MPEYDFICEECHESFVDFYSYKDYDEKNVVCPVCSSRKIARRIRRVRFNRSESSQMEDLEDSLKTEDLENNPRELGRMMRKMGSGINAEISPQFNEVVERLEDGQTSEEIEKSMPNPDGHSEEA